MWRKQLLKTRSASSCEIPSRALFGRLAWLAKECEEMKGWLMTSDEKWRPDFARPSVDSAAIPLRTQSVNLGKQGWCRKRTQESLVPS